jgi:hypothetical protein
LRRHQHSFHLQHSRLSTQFVSKSRIFSSTGFDFLKTIHLAIKNLFINRLRFSQNNSAPNQQFIHQPPSIFSKQFISQLRIFSSTCFDFHKSIQLAINNPFINSILVYQHNSRRYQHSFGHRPHTS